MSLRAYSPRDGGFGITRHPETARQILKENHGTIDRSTSAVSDRATQAASNRRATACTSNSVHRPDASTARIDATPTYNHNLDVYGMHTISSAKEAMSNEPEVVPSVEVLPNTTDESVTMSKDALNKLITSRMGKAGADARAEAAAFKVENDRLKAVVAGKGSEDELEALKGQLASERLQNQSILDASIRQQRDLIIAQEAAKANFIDVDTMQRLVRSNLRHNAATGAFEVVSDDGVPVLDQNQASVSITEFFQDYGNKKPWLVRGQVKSGGGGTGSSGHLPPTTLPLSHYWGPGSNGAATNLLSIQRPAEYKRLRAEAVKQGLCV